MKKDILTTVAVAAVMMVPLAGADAQEAGWFHIHVEEPDATRVNVSLPLSLVEIGLDIAERDALQEKHLEWDPERTVGLEDIRSMWAELQAAGDADFVEVVDGDSHVRISRQGDRVLVRVEEGDDTRVRIDMPSRVVDALLDVEGDRLNVRAAFQELTRSGHHELVDIRDGETTVRIWIGEARGLGSAS